MSVGIGIVGRQVIVKVAGQAFLGTQTKGLTVNNERLDTTDDNSNGWQEALAIPGEKSIEQAISGQVKNLEGLRAILQNGSQIYPVEVEYPDGSTVEGDAFMASYADTGSYNELFTFDISLNWSGAPTFTAGT